VLAPAKLKHKFHVCNSPTKIGHLR